MDIDDDDDLYEPRVDNEDEKRPAPKADDLEEGEEEDESGAMDEDDSDSVRTRSLAQNIRLLSAGLGHRHHHRTQRRNQPSSSAVCALTATDSSP
jgi:hypothetical protein